MNMRDLITATMLTIPDREAWREDALADADRLGLSVRVMSGYGGRIGDGRADAIENSEAEYFTWLDDDDRYPNTGALESMIGMLNSTDAPFAFSAERVMSVDARLICPPISVTYDHAIHRARPSHCHGLIVVRRTAVSKDIIEEIRQSQYPDHILTLRLAEKYGPPQYTRLVGRHWRQHNSNISRTKTYSHLF